MAVLNGIITKLNGSAGQLTFKQVKGRTIVSEKIAQTNNVRSSAQQKHRMKWSNLIRMYSVLRLLLTGAFESKPKNLSDYNVFVQKNFKANNVYLTKSEVASSACVAAPYQITDGTVDSIEVSGEPGASVTDISLGSLTITDSTTVGDFSLAVVLNNKDYEFGHQISFILVIQQTNPISGCPKCKFSGEAVVLDYDSKELLSSCVSAYGFSSKDGKLACSLPSDFQGAYAWIHTCKNGDDTLVSTQSLIVKNDLYETYSGSDAYKRAVASYGGESTTFLSPDTDSSESTVTGTTATGTTSSNQDTSSSSSSADDEGGL